MRGSPFTFSNFSLGLNVLDSPYTLKQGEARDCLNVVSTPRGAIKKRFGSTVFASGAAAYFPTLAATDTFKRAEEKPLSNGGKWSAVGGALLGQVNATEEWQPYAVEIAQARWNVAEQTNPAVSVLVKTSGQVQCGLWTCLSAGAESGYKVLYEVTTTTVILSKVVAGVATALGEVVRSIANGDSLGITVRSGVVTVWVEHGSGWESLVSVADATYTKGYGGIIGIKSGILGKTGPTKYQNFTIGEAPAPPAEAEFLSLLPCKTAGGNFLIAASGTKLFSITEAGEITEIGSGFTEGKRWSLVQAAEGTRVAKGPIYLSNGITTQSWTGAAKNTATTPWTSKGEGEFIEISSAGIPEYMVYFANRIWAANLTSEGSALRWSGFATVSGREVADPTNWPKANINYFDKDDGQSITGLGTVGPYLLVFKAHKTWVVYDLNEGENRRISDSTGCIANRSIVETPLGTFFLSPDQGVFITNGSKVQEMSRNVRPILQGTDPLESRAAKLNELKNAAAGYLNGHYYLSYMAKDGTMKTLDYDTQLKSWWIHDLAGNQWVAWELKGEPFLYTVPHKAKSGIVKAFVPSVYQDSGANYTGEQYEVLQHNGETITVTLTAHWVACWEPFWQYFMRHRFQQPQIKKRIRTLFVDAKGEVEGYAWRNFGTKPQRLKGVVENADIALESTYTPQPGTATTEYQAVRFYSLGTGRVWSFMFANQTAEPFEVDTYAADLYFRKN